MRKILCLLLVLTALCCLAVTMASAEEAAVPAACSAGCEDPVWVPLTSAIKWYNLEEGHYHYYLTKNDTTYRYTPNPTSDKAASSTNSKNPVTICLDLNGYSITTDGRAVGVYSGCTLNLMDSSADQTGYIQGSTGDNNTVGGTMFNYGTFNLYNGTVRYVYDGVGKNQTYAGGVLSLGSNYPDATFNMYGGRLEGGEMVVNGGNCYGGTIFAAKGKINLYAGEVISGKVQEGYNGPCIYLNGGVQVTLSGNAKADNIYVNNAGAKINVSGTFSGKARLTYGSAIALSAGKVVGTATNTPSITGDLFCTNGDGWLVNVSGSDLKLAAYTPTGERHYCEHCKEVVRWTSLTTANYKTPNTASGEYHYYLAEDRQVYFQVGAGSGKNIYSTVCLDLYGKNLTSPGGRALLPWGGSTLNLMDSLGGGIVTGSGGTNNPNGGTVTVSSNGLLNMYGGTLRFQHNAASTTTKGGTINLNGSMNLYGGTVEGAQLTAPASGAALGAAISVNKTDSVLNLCGGEVTSGTLPQNGVGPCVYVTAGSSVKLSGDARVENIYFAANEKKLTLSGTYSGTASVTFAVKPELGEEVGVAADTPKVTGRLTCTNGGWLIAPQEDKLIVTIDAPVAVVNGDAEQGYETLQAAVDACQTGYIKLFKPLEENVTVSRDAVIDLNGNSITGTITVAEGATLYGMDSQTDDYTVADGVYGKLTVSGSTAAQEGYLLVTEGDGVSFHRVTLAITDMTLRPDEAGIYYKSTFLGDEKVAGAVTRFGVALSVYAVPDEDNMETLCRYSIYGDFVPGTAGNASNSTLLKGVLKTENEDSINARNLNMDIYGRPYIQTADGYLFGQTRSRDLAQQLQGVDEIVDTLNVTQLYKLEDMYRRFEAVLSNMSLPNIVKEINDDTLRILMVGNSFCYYYVEELYGLLTANPDPDRGYGEVEIYNLYYSGCKLNQHYDWWKSGAANYQLYRTDVNGRRELTSAATGRWTLEETLQLDKWDYISLQGASTEVDYVTQKTESICAAIIPYTEPLLERFHELHPKAQLLWHRTWTFEDGRVTGTRTYDEESLAAYDAGMQAVCDYMCSEFDKDKDYDLVMVNSGAAWTAARAENARLETSLIPDGGLCARLGIRNESTYPYFSGNANAGDGYHDGDIGGGQFLNACVWYETLTGQSVLDNPYKPTTANGKYELSDALAELLRNAAHTALNKE